MCKAGKRPSDGDGSGPTRSQLCSAIPGIHWEEGEHPWPGFASGTVTEWLPSSPTSSWGVPCLYIAMEERCMPVEKLQDETFLTVTARTLYQKRLAQFCPWSEE